jgi:FKBP-type peptidyl-prolyl cis-trans isomerase
VESGIHEGIKLMRVGEKSKLVFPSHLAHGLVGDLKDIPPLSPLVVDIELIELQ